eukprot:752055-Hanusia_phi.AAC.4
MVRTTGTVRYGLFFAAVRPAGRPARAGPGAHWHRLGRPGPGSHCHGAASAVTAVRQTRETKLPSGPARLPGPAARYYSTTVRPAGHCGAAAARLSLSQRQAVPGQPANQ